MGAKTYFKDLQNPSFYPHSLFQSLAVIILFALSLLPSEERWGKKGGGGGSLLDLNLLSSEFRRDDMQPRR